MRCEEIMKRDIECVSPRTTAAEAARKMREGNVGFLPVCQPEGRAVGTLTDRDLALRLVAEGKRFTTPVGELMTTDIISCRPSDDLRRAELLMAEHHKSRMLCIEPNGELAGVISLSDVAQHEQAARLSETLRHVAAREARA